MPYFRRHRRGASRRQPTQPFRAGRPDYLHGLRALLAHERLETRLLLDGALPLAVSVLGPGGLTELVDHAFSLGEVAYRSAAEHRFFVTNAGTGSLELSARIDLPSGFRLTAELALLELGPNESTSFAIEFTSAELGPLSGAVTLHDAADLELTCSFVISADSIWNPADDLGLFSTANVLELRQSLIREVWKTDQLPDALPAVVETNVDSPIEGLVDLAAVERWTVDMDLGLNSIVYLLQPAVSNQRLFLVHQGHGDDLAGNGLAATVQSLLTSGFTVLTFWMPEGGANARPYGSHNELAGLETPELNPMKFFIEPVVEAINLATQRDAWLDISMTGISGGGWTTTLAAALDPRIQFSFPVAGSLPDALRDSYNVGDYEQSNPLFFDDVSYLELYALGGFGVDRVQTQILIWDDPVAYSARGIPDYAPAVEKTLALTGGGEFRRFVDRSQREHQISPWVVEHVLLATLGVVSDGGAADPANNFAGPATYWTVDNDDDAFAAPVDWQTTPLGAGGSSRVSDLSDSAATWQFVDLPSGLYDAQISWTPRPDAADAALVTLIDPARPDEPLFSMVLDQRLPPTSASGAAAESPAAGWTTLIANHALSSGALTVSLANGGAGFAVADLVRVIRRAGLDEPTLDFSYSGERLASGDPISFGSLLLGATETRSLTVRNASNEVLILSSAVALPDGLEWIEPQFPILAPGATTIVQIQFSAYTAGTMQATVMLDLLRAAAPPIALLLTAAVQPLEVRAGGRLRYSQAGAADFGVSVVGIENRLSFELINRTQTWLDLADGLALPAGFELRSQLPSGGLAPGESSVVEVALAAEAPGVRQGELIIASPAFAAPLAFRMVGTAFDRWTIDNDAPGSAFEGSWDLYQDLGNDGDARQSWPEYGPADAIWRFTGIAAGEYQVAFTWTPFPLRATNAVATIYDGPYKIGTIVLDQTMPADAADPDGQRWTESPLGFAITTGALIVRLSNDADGPVLADAVRIRAFTPEPPRQHNAALPNDVNGDGVVTPLDALIVIDRLNQPPLIPLADTAEPTASLTFPDVNDDGRVTPLDALNVINFLNAPPPSQPLATGSLLALPPPGATEPASFSSVPDVLIDASGWPAQLPGSPDAAYTGARLDMQAVDQLVVDRADLLVVDPEAAPGLDLAVAGPRDIGPLWLVDEPSTDPSPTDDLDS